MLCSVMKSEQRLAIKLRHCDPICFCWCCLAACALFPGQEKDWREHSFPLFVSNDYAQDSHFISPFPLFAVAAPSLTAYDWVSVLMQVELSWGFIVPAWGHVILPQAWSLPTWHFTKNSFCVRYAVEPEWQSGSSLFDHGLPWLASPCLSCSVPCDDTSVGDN